MAVRSSSCSWVIRPCSTALAMASWKDGCDSPGARTMLALSIPSIRTLLIARWAALPLYWVAATLPRRLSILLTCWVRGGFARVGLADDRG